MIYEETIKYLPMPDFDDYGSYVEEAYNTAIEVLEKADKYAWHDLRKNPNDLPDDGNVVIGITKNGKCEFLIYHNDEKWTWQYRDFAMQYASKVIAWKEIEQFEEEIE